MIIVTINKTLTEAFFCPPLLIEYKKLKKNAKARRAHHGPSEPIVLPPAIAPLPTRGRGPPRRSAE